MAYNNRRQEDTAMYEVHADSQLLQFLLDNAHGSRNKLKDTLKGRGVKVNGKVTTQFDYPLKPGMTVTVSKSKRNEMFKSRYVKIVYEDRWLVVVEKNIGILSMAAGHSSLNVKSVLDDYFHKSRQKCRAHVVHRLDRDTSGLMIYAKDMENKAYVTYSSPTDNGGKYAVTHFHVLNRTTEHSLVEYRLETGRKNQIRVHSADMGHPVCGDIKYGNGDDPIHRLCLHAYVLCFTHPVTGERMEFDTQITAAFCRLFK